MDAQDAMRATAGGGDDGGIKYPAQYILPYVVVQTLALKIVRGLGLLAFLWSTVVLLGGYVSALQWTDFRFIAAISLVLFLGVFSVFANGQYLFIAESLWDLMKSYVHRINWRTIFWDVAVMLAMTVLLIVTAFLPASLAVISIWFSWQRLKQQDYGQGDGTDASKANLKPAAVFFYSLALAQCALFLLCYILELGSLIMAWQAAKDCRFEGIWGRKCVRWYITETKVMCMEDLSATRGRNVITFASGKLDSDDEEGYLSGARMLVAFIDQKQLPVQELIRSSRNRIQKLLMMLAWKRSADREIRLLAAKIVAHVASDISLAQFPGTLECVSSLLVPSKDNNILYPTPSKKNAPTSSSSGNANSDETQPSDKAASVEALTPKRLARCIEVLCSYWRSRNTDQKADQTNKVEDDTNAEKTKKVKDDTNAGQKNDKTSLMNDEDANKIQDGKREFELIEQGLDILNKLTLNKHNCAEICKDEALLILIRSWIYSKPFIIHGQQYWLIILRGCLNVLERLTSLRIEGASQLCNRILMDIPLSCISGYSCYEELQIPAIKIFADLFSADRSDNNSSERKAFLNLIMTLFLSCTNRTNGGVQNAELQAGDALFMVSFTEVNCMHMVKLKEDIHDRLYEIIDVKYNIAYRALAAGILSRLYRTSDLEKNKEGLQKVIKLLISAVAQGNPRDEQNYFFRLQAAFVSMVEVIVHIINPKHNEGIQAEHADVIAATEAKIVIIEDILTKAGSEIDFVNILNQLIDMSEKDAMPGHLVVVKWVASLIRQMLMHKVFFKQIKEQNTLELLERASKSLSGADSWAMFDRNPQSGVKWITTLDDTIADIRKLLNQSKEPTS